MTDALKAIRFITRKWPPAVGGMETYGARLTEELQKRGPVEIIALPGRESGRRPTVLALIGFGLRTSIRLLVAREARVVHVADLASWPFAWIAGVRHPHSRLVLSAHGSDLSFAERPGWRSKLYRAYVRTGAAAVRHAHVIANSNYIAELARKAGFERVSIVPLATDFRCASGGEQSHLLYAGRITGEKGLRFLVEEVLPRLPIEVRLRVAGAVWEKSERSVLDHPQVDYLGVLSPQQLANEFGDAAVVLIPTRTYEGFGLVAIEAGACGAWVIASNHSGLADVVEPPIGIAVAPDNAEAWVHAIESALSLSAKERAANSQAARAKVDRCYRWPRVAEATLAIYEEDRPA